MIKPNVGDVIYIQSFKHDESLHRTWSSGTVIEVDFEKVVLITYKTWVVEADGRRWFTREPAICFYYFNRWYNVIAMIRPKGIYYYCNLASPVVYDGEALKNIDYDLDLKVFPDWNYHILDRDEFIDHQHKMGYSSEIVDYVEVELERLINVVKGRNYPFSDDIVNGYFEKYLNLTV